MKIGHGFDAHRFGSDKPLMVGGVKVPHDKGLVSHSDGDFVLHALCDALLGAAGLGDIGQHFPDSNPEYKNVNSQQFVIHVVSLVYAKKLTVSNVDITIFAQKPKLAPHIPGMCQMIAEELHIDRSRVNVKATTTEKLGFIGREEGLAAEVVVLLNENTDK